MLKHALFAALLACTCLSCDNELNVTADWKDIPVVYGILSPVDSLHYIRIEKAFLDPSTSALEVARIADSLYYDALDASVVDVASGERYQLEEVDGNLVGLMRDEGIFASSPNRLYRVAQEDIRLKANQKYRLEINRSERLPLVTAETEITQKPQIKRPFFQELLRFQYTNQFKVLWQEAENAFFYDVRLIIHYDETDPGNPGELIAKSLEWPIARNVTFNEVEVLGIKFYEFLRAEINANPSVQRFLRGIDVEVRSGGQELYEFRRIQQANTGITSVGGDIPRYTNMSEGIGILTASNSDLETGYELHPEALDSLRFGTITADLNFQ
ncbi:MAG: DUF4249 family protein [Saprospiraceae bacterium]|nr:DUF4249 family protein [Saprospiraceae bacterium]